MKSISEAKWKVSIDSRIYFDKYYWWYMVTEDDIGEDGVPRQGEDCKTKSDAETALQEYMKINNIRNWTVVE
jgi:hypothetical protein